MFLSVHTNGSNMIHGCYEFKFELYIWEGYKCRESIGVAVQKGPTGLSLGPNLAVGKCPFHAGHIRHVEIFT
jgi:hypothetical protein